MSVLENINYIKKNKCVCLLAPSFVIDFNYPEIIKNLKEIGFNKIYELTYAAKMINIHTRKTIKENKNKRYICANCPSIVNYIENNYSELKKNIIDIASPMVVMGRFVKHKHKNYKTIFVGPCLVKHLEAKKYPEAIDKVLTFKDIIDIFDYYKKNKLKKKEVKGSLIFNSCYNDYTKIYPLSGAVAETMHIKNILKKEEILVVDGYKKLKNAVELFKKDKSIRFLDALFCVGGCAGGPGIASTKNIEERAKRIINYRVRAKKEKIGKNLGKFKMYEGIDITR